MRLPSLTSLLAIAALTTALSMGAGAYAAHLMNKADEARGTRAWANHVTAVVFAETYDLTVTTTDGHQYVEDEGQTLAECEAAAEALTGYHDATGLYVELTGLEAVECL